MNLSHQEGQGLLENYRGKNLLLCPLDGAAREVTVQTRAGGCTVTLVCPQCEARLLSERNALTALAGPSSALGPRPILILEGAVGYGLALQAALRHVGVLNPVCIVKTFAEGVSHLRPDPATTIQNLARIPGIVLLDLNSAATEGFQLLQWLHGISAATQLLVVAIIHQDDRTTSQRAYALGAHSFITRPLRATDLNNLILGFPAHWHRRALSPEIAFPAPRHAAGNPALLQRPPEWKPGQFHHGQLHPSQPGPRHHAS
jgi:CheY-like chemotaxis protein